MKPFKHAKISSKKYGGQPEDYLAIHEYMDRSKQCFADVRHRMLLHHAAGVFVVADVFGHHIKNSDGRTVSVRDIVEDHIKDDLGFIPSLEHWARNMPIQKWMGGNVSKSKFKNKVNPSIAKKEKIKSNEDAVGFLKEIGAVVDFDEIITVKYCSGDKMRLVKGVSLIQCVNQILR